MTTTEPDGLRLRAAPAFNGIPCWHRGGRYLNGHRCERHTPGGGRP